jgi:hypothetical protein
MFGSGGETAARAVQIGRIQVRHAARKEWRVLVSGEGTLGSNIAVVLGYDFLQKRRRRVRPARRCGALLPGRRLRQRRAFVLDAGSRPARSRSSPASSSS